VISDWIVSETKREADWWTTKVAKSIEERMPSVKKGVNFARQIVAVAVDGNTVEYRVASDWLFWRIKVLPEDRGPSHFERLRKVMEGLGWTHSESIPVGKRSMEGYTKREAIVAKEAPPSLHRQVADAKPVVEPEDVEEPKAKPISPDGPLAAILKMPIASVAARPSWRRF
jgi:hypothetical protein